MPTNEELQEQLNELLEQEKDGRRRLIEQNLEHARTGEHLLDIQMRDLLTKNKYGKAVTRTTKSMGELAKGAKDSAKSMVDSGGNFTDLSDAAAGVANALVEMSEAVPFAGKAVSALGKAAIEAAQFAFGRFQAGFEGFQELSEIGQIGSEGIAGMVDDFDKARMPLQSYLSVLKENSESLAYFSESALMGGQTFAKTMNDMAGETGKPLRRLGFTVEQIGETVIDFQKMQRLQGFRQTMTQAELQKKTMAYGKELDLVAKLTGKQRKDIQKEREALMGDARFRTKISEMQAKNQGEQALALSDFVNIVGSHSSDLGKAISDMSTGLENTSASQKALMTGFGPVIRETIAGLESGNLTVDQALNRVAQVSDSLSGVESAAHQAARAFESGESPFVHQAQMRDLAGMQNKSMDELRKGQDKLATAVGTQTDTLVTAQMKMQNAAKGLDALTLESDIAAGAIAGLATGMDELTKLIRKATGAEEVQTSKYRNADGSMKMSLDEKEIEDLKAERQAMLSEGWDNFKSTVGGWFSGDEATAVKTAGPTTAKKQVEQVAKEVLEPVKKYVAPPETKSNQPAPAEKLATAIIEHEKTIEKKEKMEAVARGGHKEFAEWDRKARADGLDKDEKAQGREMLNTLHSIEQELKGLRGLTRQQAKEIKELKQITKNAS